MNQVLVRPEEVTDGGQVVLTGRRATHVADVLQMPVGEHVRVGLLGGARGRARICEASPGRMVLSCTFDVPPLPPSGIRLLLALPRPKVLRRLFPVLAAFGVEEVFLTNAAKVERPYFDTHWLNPDQYTTLLLEGLEQSGETRLPDIRVVRRLKPFVEDALPLRQEETRLLLHPAGTAPAATAPYKYPLLAAIGPEGGWTDYEVALLGAHGFTCVSLGPRILRTDTAVAATLGWLQAQPADRDGSLT